MLLLLLFTWWIFAVVPQNVEKFLTPFRRRDTLGYKPAARILLNNDKSLMFAFHGPFPVGLHWGEQTKHEKQIDV